MLEGLSGSGKTTIGKKLARAMHAKFCSTPLGPFAKTRSVIDNASVSPNARFFFYLGGVLDAWGTLHRLLATHDVVCDRYFLTTYCYHKAIGATPPSSLNNLLQEPDFTFLITCKEEERRRRLGNRGLDVNDKREVQLRSDRKFLQEYRKFHLAEIDNTPRDPNLAVEKILAIVRPHP